MLKSVSLEFLLPHQKPITLLNFSSIDGNISLYEMVALSNLISYYNPLNLLEIGTFNGNITLHMALNSAKESMIHTLDLESEITKFTLLPEEIKYIKHPSKKAKKYHNTFVEHKIKEHLGDSATYNFQLFIQHRLLDFVFIATKLENFTFGQRESPAIG